MTKAMSADRRQPGPPAGAVDDARDGAGVDSAERRIAGEDDTRGWRGRSTVAQIRGDRLADIHSQRKPVIAQGLSPHPNLPNTPVDVRQLQGGDLTGAQTQTAQQIENREIAKPA